MYNEPYIDLNFIINEFKLELISNIKQIKSVKLHNNEVNRPALQLAGFYDHFDEDRLQILGKVEYIYLSQMNSIQKKERICKLLEYNIPALILCKGFEVFDELLECENFNNIPILIYKGSTSEFMGDVIRILSKELAPTITKHGVLVDIYGEGVLITGDSGVGKSETAIELIRRGHRLVADDAVEIKKIDKNNLLGCSPEIIKYFIELRGVGIIDIKKMFGVHSVKDCTNIDLVVNLEFWDEDKDYDRIGVEDEYINILGTNVVCNNIPIRPGRNIAIICEAAAINYRQKKMGYNAAQVLNEKIINSIKN